MSAVSCLFTAVWRCLLFSILVYVSIGFLVEFTATHSFDHERLHAIVNDIKHTHTHIFTSNTSQPHDYESATRRLNEAVDLVHSSLYSAYPSHILPPGSRQQWTANLAGGFKTQMLVLHGSLSEYVMIWGSQTGTIGHSGRNWAEFHDFLLSGRGDWWAEGGLDVKTERPGDYIFTPKFAGGIVRLHETTFMLEYCRGSIPVLLPFGLADSLVSSLDPVTVGHSLWIYGRMVLKELFVNWKI